MCYPMGVFWDRTRYSLIFTWVYLSLSSTPTRCKCLFVVYAFFLWEASCYESCLVSDDDSIYYMMDLANPLWNSLQVSILHLRHHSSWAGTLLPFLLVYFFIAGRFCINDVAQQCHITALFLRPIEFFESIIIFFFICPHLFFGTSLILLFL